MIERMPKRWRYRRLDISLLWLPSWIRGIFNTWAGPA